MNETAPTAPDRPRRPSRGRKLGWQLLAVVVFLAALEAVLRLAGVQPVARDPYQGFSGFRPLFVPADTVEPGGDPGMRVTAPGKAPWFNAQRFAADKPAGTFRIFTLGGSTTYGRPYDDRLSFSAWMRELLPAADSSRDWEVINAGGISYASDRVAAILDELIAYEPDLFVLYTGHNEWLEERTYADLADRSGLFRSVAGLLSRTRLFAVIQGALRGGAEAPTDTPRAVSPEVVTRLDSVVGLDAYERDLELDARIAVHFRRNLERMVDTAHAAGARVVLVTPASALKDCAPFKSQPEAEGVADADLHYERALLHLAQGRLDRAEADFTAAREWDVCPLRAPIPIIGSVRTVAHEKGVPLVDFVEVLGDRMEAEHGHRAPGAEWFLDHVHPTVAGHELLALEILDAMTAEGWLTPSNGLRDVILPAVRRRMEARLTPELQGFAWRNLAKVLSWSGQHERADAYARRAEEVLGAGDSETQFLLGNNARERGDLKEAARRYGNATAIDDGYAEAFFNHADVLLKLGRADEAIGPAGRAVELLPDTPDAHGLLGLAHAGAGDHEAALRPLANASDLDPSDPAPPNNLGLSFIALGQPAFAERAFAESVGRDPGYVRGHYNLALARLAQGKTTEARAALHEVLALDPDHSRARERLAQLDGGGGDGDDGDDGDPP